MQKMSREPTKWAAANRLDASPFGAGWQFARAFHAPRCLSVGVAERDR